MIVFNQIGRGTFWRAYYLAHSLALKNHQVTLLANSRHSRFHLKKTTVEKITLIETPDLLPGIRMSGWDLSCALRRIFWIDGNNFNIVHAFESRPTVIYPALKAKNNGAKLILDWCDFFGKGGSVEERPNVIIRTILRPIETYFENHFRTIADGTTVINDFLRKKAIDLCVDPDSITTIKNGCNIQFEPIDKERARVELGLPLETPIIGFVGGLFQKDALFMAEAFNELLVNMPNAKLLLIGYFNRQINNLIAKPSSFISTQFIEYEQIHKYLSACDVCWLPLRKSAANLGRLPMKLNDYMTAGRPTVSTNVGDVENVLTEHNIGLISDDNARDFADLTAKLLNEPNLLMQLGNNARRASINKFSWAKITCELESHYNKILSKDR